MRLALPAVAVVALSGCAATRNHTPAHRSLLRLDVDLGVSAAQLTLHLAQPSYVVVIEQHPGGWFALLEPDSGPRLDVPALGEYRLRVTRHSPWSPPALAAPPNPPCAEGVSSTWTGYCGLSPGMAFSTRELAMFPTSPQMSRPHRVFALALPGRSDPNEIKQSLDSLPAYLTPPEVAERLGQRLAPMTAGLVWAAVDVPARRRAT